jgi:hypothetical protein
LHHREFELSGITLDNIQKIIKEKYAIYDLNVDQRSNKIGRGKKLVKIDDNDLPRYIVNNKKKISEWFD